MGSRSIVQNIQEFSNTVDISFCIITDTYKFLIKRMSIWFNLYLWNYVTFKLVWSIDLQLRTFKNFEIQWTWVFVSLQTLKCFLTWNECSYYSNHLYGICGIEIKCNSVGSRYTAQKFQEFRDTVNSSFFVITVNHKTNVHVIQLTFMELCGI